MKPQDDDQASKPRTPKKPTRTEEARRIVDEYVADLRALVEKLQKLLH
jgi:hypothetical protein